MNWDQIEGKWEQAKGQVKQHWGKLTDNDLTMIKGKRQQLIGKLQERYGYAANKAEEEVERFIEKCGAENCDFTKGNDRRVVNQ